MPTNNDVLALQMERVRSKLQDLFETSNTLSARVKKSAEVEQISTRDYRIPNIFSYGGDFGKFDPDGGDMGLGSGMESAYMVGTYFPVKIAFQITNLQMYATATSERAVAKVFAKTMASAIKEFQVYDDYSFHTAGSGIFAKATAQATVTGATEYTLDTTLATQLCRRKAMCRVYSNDLQTDRGEARIIKVDVTGNKVRMGTSAGANLTVAGAANDDVLVFHGVSGASPVWKNGLYALSNTVTTGNFQSLSKVTYPELVGNGIAVGGPLAAGHGLMLLDQITQRRDDIGNLSGVAHMKQRTAWYLLGMQISEWDRSGKSNAMLDIVPEVGNGTGSFKFCGIDHLVDKHQDRTRIDWLDFKNIGRAVLKDLDYHTVDGIKLFPLRGATGGIAAGMLFYLEQHEDWYTPDPGKFAALTTLSIPTV
jgi:hypothetical protein